MASAMLNNDTPVSLIQDLLGHASPTVTRQVYASTTTRPCAAASTSSTPSVAQQVAELEAEDARRSGHPT